MIDAAPSRLRLELLNPLKIKSSLLEVVDFRWRKKKKRRDFVKMETMFNPAKKVAVSEMILIKLAKRTFISVSIKRKPCAKT